MITTQILQAVQECDLVVADLTEHNPNVFYELAVRHSIEKPIIHVIDTYWPIPFDVSGFRTIFFDFTDLDSVAAAIKDIRSQASEISKGNWGGTPIKVAGLMRRTQGESQETLLLQETLNSVTALRQEIQKELMRMTEYLRSQIETLGSGVRGPAHSQVEDMYGLITGRSNVYPSPLTSLSSLLGTRPSGFIEVDNPVIPIPASPTDVAKSADEEGGKKKG